MAPLHRHQLAWLSEAGWRQVHHQAWDATARECLRHWAAQRLPLVVTRQASCTHEAAIALGLPAPGRWSRRRIALTVPRNEVLAFGEFPPAADLLDLLPLPTRAAWRHLCGELKLVGVSARVYGSCGWQLLNGLDHMRAESDIDLWLSVSDAAQADSVASCLQAASSALPRLDGELMFGDGSAVAWREWLDWRAARVKSILVKTFGGSSLVHTRHWPDRASATEAV